MPYPTHTEGAYTVIRLTGQVDLRHSPAAREQILTLLGNGHNVVADLSQVAYIDSSGVASLVEGYQLARRKRLNFTLAGVSEATMQVLRLARLDKVFPIRGSSAPPPDGT